MTLTKNQIRPRRQRVRFTDADILLLDTTAFIELIPTPGPGVGLALQEIQIVANYPVTPYGGIDVGGPFLFFSDTFSNSFLIEDIPTSAVQNFTALFGSSGLSVFNAAAPKLVVDDSATFTECGPGGAFTYSDLADLAAFGSIFFAFSNGGADLTGGAPANTLDFFISYNLVNLVKG